MPAHTFRRNTHTREGVFRGDAANGPEGGGLYHWLSSDHGMTFDAWAEAIEGDAVNFYHGRYGVGETDEAGRVQCSTRAEMALALVAMLEAGLVEMVPEGWAWSAPEYVPRAVRHSADDGSID